jgi:hypothetical protein
MVVRMNATSSTVILIEVLAFWFVAAGVTLWAVTIGVLYPRWTDK